MSKKKPNISRSKTHLLDILEMIKRIDDYTKKVGMNFRNLAYYDSTLMRLQVIGESIKKLPKEKLEKYPDVAWREFIQFREVVSHEYFKINYRLLNDALRNELEKLKNAVKDILEEENKK